MSDSADQQPTQQEDICEDSAQGQTAPQQPSQPPAHPDLSAKVREANERSEARRALNGGC